MSRQLIMNDLMLTTLKESYSSFKAEKTEKIEKKGVNPF